MPTTPASMAVMQEQGSYKALQQCVGQTAELLSEVCRKMEGLVAENHRLREVARLSENELETRCEQMRKLELRVQELDLARTEARDRVSQSMEELDGIMINMNKEGE
ncbi:MAG: hypothetical protein R8M38_04530 [Mariprofundaceae bacterium]